ncbi:hypothetical protein, partial [Bacillus sp. EB600]|uniref:hypothetical protein n=1 Tax=Bacillus sp. EB600 TaxID=2806345 RepID=UPI00210C65DE
QYNVNYSYLPGVQSSNIGVSYTGFVESDIGWYGAKTDGEMTGTTGRSLPLNQINVNLTNVSTDPTNPLSKQEMAVLRTSSWHCHLFVLPNFASKQAVL